MPRLRRTLLAASLLASAPSFADETGPRALPLVEQASGTYYVRVVFGPDIESDLLVDTGSSYVALTRATARRLEDNELLVYARTIYGKTAAGRRIKVKVYTLAEFSLAGGCSLRDIEAVVLPGADRDILGLTALRKLGRFTLAFDPPALSYTSCDSGDPAEAMAAAAPPSDG